MGYEVDNLITDLRDDVQASPSAESSLTAQLMRALNREQRLFLTALLQKVGGKYKQATLDFTTDGSTARFGIPARAIAAGIVMAEMVSGTNRTQIYELGDDDLSAGNPKPGDFYIEGNELVFHRAPASGTLRVTYNRRLSKLVLLAEVGVITGGSAVTGQVTISAAPTAFPTSTTSYDFVRATPHFDILAMNKDATRTSTTMFFTASDLPTGVTLGDYVCLAGESAVVQAPLELHRVLTLRTAYMWSRAKNDPIAAQLKDDLRDAIRDAMVLLEPRNEQEPVLSNPNAPGWGFSPGRRFPSGTPT